MANAITNYPKGSEWRKWDLHAHTPHDHEWIKRINTKDEEEIKVFAKDYINFAIEQDLSVIAVTDHNFYDEVDNSILSAIIKESNTKAVTILPGCEITAKDGSGIHILIIFKENTPLGKIKSLVDQFFVPNQPKFTEGSVAVSNKSIDEIKHLVDLSGLDAVFIFAHADRDNGVLQKGTITGIRRIEEWHKPFIKICQLAKSPKDYESGFIHNVVNNLDTNYRKDMAYIIASDCRTIEIADKVEGRHHLGEKFVWIKADPTLEGLKQIIHEPERVYIGEYPPLKINKNKIISSLEINDSKTWFSEDVNTYNFNEDFVSIIGGKGTGKTALLDLIAYASGSLDEKDEKSFVFRAKNSLKGMKVTVNWADGTQSVKIIGDKLFPKEPIEKQKVLYLNQSFVETLVSPAKEAQLTEQIERVIFQSIPSEIKSGYTSFEQLKVNTLQVIKDKKDKTSQLIREANKALFELVSQYNKKPTLKAFLHETMSTIHDIIAKIEDIKSKQGPQSQQDFASITRWTLKKLAVEKFLSELNQSKSKYERLHNTIDSFKYDAFRFAETLKLDLFDYGLHGGDVEKIKVDIQPPNLLDLLNAVNDLNAQRYNKAFSLLEKIKLFINEKQNNLNLEKSRSELLLQLQLQLENETKIKEACETELQKITLIPDKIKTEEDKREKLYLSFFYQLHLQSVKLKQLYNPLTQQIRSTDEENTNLFEFDVKHKFHPELMSDLGNNLIDKTKVGRYRQRDNVELLTVIKDAFDSLTPKSQDSVSENDYYESNKDLIITAVDIIRKTFTTYKEDQISISSQLREKVTEEDFDNWLFDTRYFDVDYSIKFNTTELDKLSPGLKGLALLILFLELDREDIRPLLIDQPEENLDNRSVYETLRKYFLRAKKRRQIFLVTHNPNLVVNTDSEQIFVSNFSKSRSKQLVNIAHISGALENSVFLNGNDPQKLESRGIRQHICHILEGGEDAFKARERKYDILNN